MVFYMEKYEDWKEKYYNEEVVDLKDFFTQTDFDIIKKLGVEVLEKKYTESEFENLYSNILNFYEEDNLQKKIEDTDVTKEEYDELLKKFEQINEKYDF